MWRVLKRAKKSQDFFDTLKSSEPFGSELYTLKLRQYFVYYLSFFAVWAEKIRPKPVEE